jgi:drug/metabolite transporter (DMT)-like permease
MDTILRGMGDTAPVVEKFFFLTLAASAVVFLYGTRCGRDFTGLRTHHLKLHGLRAAMYILRFSIIIYCLPHLPLVNYFALIFTGPLFVTAMSSMFLKERVGIHCWLATGVGFIGVMIDLRPSSDLDIYSVLVLITAFFNSVDIIMMRFTNRRDSTASTSFYVQALSLVPVAFYMAWNYQPISTVDIGLASTAGVLSGLALMTMTAGYRMATTPVAAPFNYTQLIWGAAIGWLVWRDVPDLWTWVGGVIIAGSGLYILRKGPAAAAEPEAEIPNAV